MRSGWLIRGLSWIAAMLVGGFYGVAGTVAHSVMWGPVPIGLIVAGTACLALLVAIRALTHDRGATLATGLGMMGMLILISGPGPGGSVIVPDTPLAQVWLWVVAGSVLLVVAWPAVSRFAPPAVAPPSTEPPASGADDAAGGSRLNP
ncbi:histidinol dehydrogenase [Microbacterium sp. NIBRBAC000506063]|uniref:histidinol dehydrogenase n=1 Tax=Microbacterium sp. NIBRBAC000506063 TaxID=2734618 RepID=UPI001BB58B76|nr:histidinol dehydrogenase [Microbacterium sp. NIBRBAC000506063]QTV79831.1 histidinol dehydrogenase [Microbacterium sp. NIBRBAC000506063]